MCSQARPSGVQTSFYNDQNTGILVSIRQLVLRAGLKSLQVCSFPISISFHFNQFLLFVIFVIISNRLRCVD